MSDILDAIDKIANASVEAMGKLPEVPDDVTWAWRILESVDGAGVRADVSLTRIIEKLELMSHGSSIISPDAVSYDAEKRLREAVATMYDWKERVWNTALELEVAAVRMIIVCEILRQYSSDSELHDLINHGLIRVIHRMTNSGDDVRLVFDSGETAAVVASFPRSVWGDRAVDGLEDDDNFFSVLDVEGAKRKALSLAGELSDIINEADRIKSDLEVAVLSVTE